MAADATTPDFFVPPAELGFEDPGIIDVTRWNADPALNANPAPGNNDHAALQAVINAYSDTGKIIYLPAGEYEIDRPLVFPISQTNRATANTILQGQNRDAVTIRVGQNAGLEGAALQFQIITADAFRNAVRDLTIDIAAGNPLADGLRFTGNNQATVKNVHLRAVAPDGSGRIGLQLGTGENGPLLVEDVSVEGFDIGIRTAIQTASQAFEDITLTQQRQFGWVNEADQNVFVRNLTSVNEVRAIQNYPVFLGQNAVFTLVDSTLRGVGDAANEVAIFTEERLYARNVATPGYARPVAYRPSNGYISGNMNLEGDYIEEYWSEGGRDRRTGGTHELFEGTPDGSLRLEVREAPEIPLETDFTRWASPTSFATTNHDGTPSGVPGDPYDDSAAIQAAIDSGATTIYLPSNGGWIMDEVVELRGNVERFLGLESGLGSPTGDGRLRLGEGTAPAVVIERLARGRGQTVTVEHASDRTLVARNLQGFDYQAITDAPGDLFIYDVVNGSYEFRNQNVWAWQLNVEGTADVHRADLPDQKILNDNSNLWVLGLKIENAGTVVRTINGGRTELLGVYRNNSTFSDADNPAFVTEDAALSVVNFDQATAAADAWAVWASETREGVTVTSERFDGAHVYSAFSDQALWDVHREVVVDNLDPEVTYTGVWQSSATLPGGYLDSDIAFSREAGATATFAPSLPVAGQYEVFVRWIDNFGVTDHTNHGTAVPLQVVHQDGTTNLHLRQNTDGGKWVSVGTYSFAEGDGGLVVLGTEANGRSTIADGVRFALRATDQPLPESPPFPIVVDGDLYDQAIHSGGVYAFDAEQGLLANDRELQGAALSVAGATEGIGGTVTVASDGAWTYAAHPWFTGWDSFQYTVSNGDQQTVGTVRVFVQDPLSLVDGQPVMRREWTLAERKEQGSSRIETVRVEEFNGRDASALLGAGLLPGAGVSQGTAHARNGDGIFFTGPTDASATFDLGGLYQLDTVRVWNYNQQEESGFFLRHTDRGAAVLHIYADADSDANGAADNLTLVRTLHLPEASARNDYTGEVFDLQGLEARFVQVRVAATHGDDTAAGLSDIEFRGRQLAEATSPEVPHVFVQSVSSDPNPDRRADSTLGQGYDPVDNQHSTSRGANWESAPDDATPSITYDLTDLYRIGSMRLWNYNGPDLSQGARSIDVYLSDDNVHFDYLTTIYPRPGSGQSTYNGEKFDFGLAAGRYVRLDITESHGAPGNVGLAEVKFFGEPFAAGGELPVAGVTTSNSNGASRVGRLIDGSGLDADGLYHDNAGDNRYTSNFDITPTLDFDLGRPVQLDKIHVWNFNAYQENDRGVRRMRVLTSADGQAYEDQGIYEMEVGGWYRSFHHAVNFQRQPITTRHVRFEVLSTWGDNSFTGLGEVRFFGTPFTAAPTAVSLAEASDPGFSTTDGITRLSNSSAESALRFVVAGTAAGDTVIVLADGQPIGSATATGGTTVVTTDGVTWLADGSRVITARRAAPGELPFADSPATEIVVDSQAPRLEVPPIGGGLALEALDLIFSEPVAGFDIDDLWLSRDGEPLDLAFATLEPLDKTTYRLTGLGTSTVEPGDYVLRLADDNDIIDVAGNSPDPLAAETQLIERTRAFNSRNRNYSVVPHRDTFLLDSGELSFSFVTSNNRWGGLVSKDHVNFGDGGHLTIRLWRGQVEVRLQSADRSYVLRGGDIQEHVSHDVAFRFGEAGMQLLIDGVVVDANDYPGGLGTSSGGTGNREDFVLGAIKVRSTPGQNDNLRHFLTGRISGFRVTDAQGRTVFSEAVTPYDLSSANNYFNGVDQFLEVSHGEDLALTGGEFQFTFNTADASRRQTLFSKDNTGYDDGGHVTASLVNGRVEVRLQSDGQSYYVRSEPIASNTDYRFRFRFGSQGMELYLNDTRGDTQAYAGGIEANTNALIIGASQWRSREEADRLEHYFHGTIGNFRLLREDLSEVHLFGRGDDDSEAWGDSTAE